MTTLLRTFGPSRWIGLLLCAALAAGCGKSGGGTTQSSVFTVHYHRALADYDGWTVSVVSGAVETTAASSGRDGFGAMYALTVAPGASKLAFTFRNGTEIAPTEPISVDLSGGANQAYTFAGWGKAIPRALPAVPGTDQVAVYYLRADGAYSGWGLHTWGDVARETAWSAPLQPKGVDPDLGAGFVIDVKPGGDQVNVIAHQGDLKDPGPDMGWKRSELGDIVFLTSGSATLTAVPRAVGGPEIAGASAHLVSRDTLVWKIADPAATTFELRHSPTAAVAATATDVVGGAVIPLVPSASALDPALAARMPHLAKPGWRVFGVAAADLPGVEEALKEQLVAVARRGDGSFVAATQVQTAFALDDLYAFDGPLGVAFAAGAPTLRLWAPTARSVRVRVLDAGRAEVARVDLVPGTSGVWSYAGPTSWSGLYYVYDVTAYHPLTGRIETMEVTDPYAVSLGTNGWAAQLVDLADPALRPAGWDALVKPPLDAPEDVVIYEGHLRDFSATDATVPAALRGKYGAFTAAAGNSAGRAHLAALAAAGLTHVHLLPVFDFSSVNEDPAARVDLDQPFADLCAKNAQVPTAYCGEFAGRTIAEALASLPGDSTRQQEIAGYMKGLDAFNWGYDPFHYGAPEGSYASAADGAAKVLEFREMVKGLSDLGLRVVMDVVYNHTSASGLAPASVLDKVVPGYYHRLNPETGYVETSSCCANTASEHRMMERLMVDTAVRWARDYKVDGFRFDLMGLHLKSNMLVVRDALAALTPAADGVDGSRIYLYGEGWSIGEMAGNARGVAATQVAMAGTGIGTFNDRLRDAVRGGGPFDTGAAPSFDLRRKQGFANGQFLDPNELATATDADRTALAQAVDRIKIGMAGNLATFRLVTASGGASAGANVAYNGQPTGYTRDPQEAITYVSAHDNQTLWDIQQYKLPAGLATADRVRAHELAMDVVALGQGIPFFHMGDDLLRSKSMERDSYDSGDWFNRVDWSGQVNGWRSGLPSAAKDQGNWPLVTTIFADPTTLPGPDAIASAAAHFQELLRIRKSSPLFRLRTGADVMTRVDFLNGGPAQVPGVIVMTITDGTCAGVDLDPAREAVVVIVNADRVAHDLTVPGAAGSALHPVLAASADPVVRTAAVTGETFTVPARTTAVFEKPQVGAQGAGLPCNTR